MFRLDYLDEEVIIKALVLFIFVALNADAYVHVKTISGKNAHWTLAGSRIDFYVNPAPLDQNTLNAVPTSELITVIQKSASEWSSISPYRLNIITTSGSATRGAKASLSFSSNPAFFGSGVVAVTSTSYDSDSGSIYSADIMINNSYNRSTNFSLVESSSSQSDTFLGDVITHEMGHLLGLAHSETVGSSMLFEVSKGQYTISDDDKHGIYSLYGSSVASGNISGRIVAGQRKAVFGVNVQAISNNTGKVVQSQLTTESGGFIFKNLPLDDEYMLFIEPVLNKSSLPFYYGSIENNYCSSLSFVPSFYTTCGPSGKSNPQLIRLNSRQSSVTTGDITIRCDYKISREYYANKFKSTDRETALNLPISKHQMNFFGHVSEAAIRLGTSGKGDEYTLDLSRLDSASGLLLLNLKLLSAGLGLRTDFQISVKRDDDPTETLYGSAYDHSSGAINPDQDIFVSLSTTSSDNIFTIKVLPKLMASSDQAGLFGVTKTISKVSGLYLLQVKVKAFSFETSQFENIDDEVGTAYPEDNSICTEGEALITATANTTATANLNNAAQSGFDLPVSCATISADGPGGSGPAGMMSFVVGFLLAILVMFPIKITD